MSDDSLSLALGFNPESDAPMLGGKRAVLEDWEAEKATTRAEYQAHIDRAKKISPNNYFVYDLQMFLNEHGRLTEKQIDALKKTKKPRRNRYY